MCELVQKCWSIKLNGVFWDPKTESTCISNIRKSLEVMRKEKWMSQKFTWSEKEIFKGKKGPTIGLLEDLHWYFNGLPARKNG